MELELTTEQKQKSVLASYDSFNLIIELKAKETLTEEDIDMLKRNEEHIRIMLTKEWFVSELTAKQKTELSKI
jgi:F0F1-type ATP synthase beta subunit